jgi:hypothetical protein
MSGADLIQNHDGADHQSQAVLSMVRYLIGDGIESSWDAEWKRYSAEPKVTRYDNGREQGYIIFMRSKGYKNQINLAFYEHRNSDSIYVQQNDAVTFNAPTAPQIYEGMKDKWECAASYGFGEIEKTARFIVEALKAFWDANDA